MSIVQLPTIHLKINHFEDGVVVFVCLYFYHLHFICHLSFTSSLLLPLCCMHVCGCRYMCCMCAYGDQRLVLGVFFCHSQLVIRQGTLLNPALTD